jgi:acetamidase/formamidase
MTLTTTGAVHTLDDDLANLHGWFSRRLPPRLTVRSGDVIVYRTCDAGWRDRPPGLEFGQTAGRKPPGTGHALSGPVYVEGAAPGDTLEVRVGEIVPSDWGFIVHRPGKAAISGALGGEPDDVDAPYFRHLFLDRERQVYPFAPGVEILPRPFMGIYGVAPDDDGPIPTAHPGPHGGNLDCQELGGGVTLFLPVFVPGALFSVGDGHGAQGDGEVNGAAIETGMDRLEIQLIIRKDLQIERPRAESATHLIFLAFGEDLDAALLRALRDVMAYLMEARGLSKDEAYSLASLAVDFRITQVVDGPRGVHAMLPKAIFTADPPTWRRG